MNIIRQWYQVLKLSTAKKCTTRPVKVPMTTQTIENQSRIEDQGILVKGICGNLVMIVAQITFKGDVLSPVLHGI